MAETYKKLPDGTLEITTTGNEVKSTMSEQEIVGKIAEVQTKIDHLNIDITAEEEEKAEWQAKLDIIQDVVPK